MDPIPYYSLVNDINIDVLRFKVPRFPERDFLGKYCNFYIFYKSW